MSKVLWECIPNVGSKKPSLHTSMSMTLRATNSVLSHHSLHSHSEGGLKTGVHRTGFQRGCQVVICFVAPSARHRSIDLSLLNSHTDRKTHWFSIPSFCYSHFVCVCFHIMPCVNCFGRTVLYVRIEYCI